MKRQEDEEVTTLILEMVGVIEDCTHFMHTIEARVTNLERLLNEGGDQIILST